MEKSGQLKFVPLPQSKNEKGANLSRLNDFELGFEVLFVDGHTEKQMLPIIQYQGKTIVFMADLLPTVGHIPLPYVMGYDTRPLLTINEKEKFLTQAADRDYFLFLEHDAYNELCTLKHTEKGVRLKETHKFEDIFN
jgi:glyoxylase-like metal-dependent hydrolase (beta-lactamase superfamily II)